MSHIRILLLIFTLFTCTLQATERKGRLGVGLNGQLKNGLPTLSLKFQGSRTFSFETLANFSSGDDGGFAAGLKIHRILFDEPQLNFYVAALIALEKKQVRGTGDTGFQTDVTGGSEGHLAGLKSLAFSIDFGISIYKFKDLVMETTGTGIVAAGVHFYL